MHWFLKCAAAAVVVGAVIVSHLSSEKSMATSETTSMEYLSAITLQTVEDEKEIKVRM